MGRSTTCARTCTKSNDGCLPITSGLIGGDGAPSGGSLTRCASSPHRRRRRRKRLHRPTQRHRRRPRRLRPTLLGPQRLQQQPLLRRQQQQPLPRRLQQQPLPRRILLARSPRHPRKSWALGMALVPRKPVVAVRRPQPRGPWPAQPSGK